MDGDGLLVGRYEMRRQIAAGGVGKVWLAHDLVLGRDVAVKVQDLDPDLDDAAFERFVREARSAAGLQHPNVVTIFDSGIDQDTAFLVMELLPGPTLTGYLAEHGPLDENEAVALASQIAAGLSAAHGAGVVHRDIKPANLMFDAHGVLKIVDFGIVRLTQAATTQLTVMGGIIGSPGYLSPEGIDGRPVDERGDIYSLGAVLMVMLTGRGPFDATDPLALLQQHLHAAPPQIRHRRPDLSPELDALVTQMLSKSPEDRPQSAQEVLSRLTGSTLPTPDLAAAVTVVLPSGPSVLPSPAETLLATTEQPRQRSSLLRLRRGVYSVNVLDRRQALTVLATFAVLGVLAGVLFSVPDLDRATTSQQGRLPALVSAPRVPSTTTNPAPTPKPAAETPSVTPVPSTSPPSGASPNPRTVAKPSVKPKREAKPDRTEGEKTTKDEKAAKGSTTRTGEKTSKGKTSKGKTGGTTSKGSKGKS